MRLSSLKLKGFKSFANDTIINFNTDVIGIVGPNGCGKSNVVDAIRWVLGEQKSKELRLDKMSSVIFNGTKKKKKAGVAEVSLSFDNTRNILPTEYTTVTISRTLYRTGESEYRLNGVICRLKDITSLFLDTGIGSNSYAIIELGMVDKILQNKDNARRKMFEQASGISKYKKRKHDTLNKLSATKADLDRVEDLLHEIEGNLKQLEKQARRTERYFKLKEQYKQNSIILAKIKLSSFETRESEINTQILSEEDNLGKLISQRNTYESELEKFKTDILASEKALSTKQQEFNSLVKKTDEKENRLKIIEQKLEFLGNDKIKLEKAIVNADSKIKELKDKELNYKSTLETESGLYQKMVSAYEVVKEKLDRIKNDHDAVKQELEAIYSTQKSFQDSIIDLEKQKAILKSQDQQLNGEKSKLVENIGQLSQKIQDLESSSKSINEHLAKANQAVKETEQTLGALTEKREKIQSELEALQTNLIKQNRVLDAKQNEFNLVRNLVEKMEGFPDSVKFLSNLKKWSEEAPLLTDLIYCEEQYKVAIESYLEPYLKYFVVEKSSDAIDAISTLAESQKGKANFFLLDEINKNEVSLKTKEHLGTPALSVLEYDDKYKNLFKTLLGHVYLSDSDIIDEQRKLDEGEVIISITGNYKQQKFEISGGSVGLFEGKRMGRKKNLEKLKEEIAELKSDIAKLEKQKVSFEQEVLTIEKEEAAYDLEVLKQELQKHEQKKLSTDLHLENEQAQFKVLSGRQDEIAGHLGQISMKLGSISSDILLKESEIGSYNEQIESKDSNFSNISTELADLSAKVNSRNIEMIRQQNKIELLEKELSYCVDTLQENMDIHRNSNSNIQTLERELVDNQTSIGSIKEELLGLYEIKKEGSTALTDVEKEYFTKRSLVSEKENELRSYDQKINKSKELIGAIKEKRVNVKIELTSITERLKAEFEIDTNDLTDVVFEDNINEEELDLKVSKAKDKIANFGEINPMALTAYDEMKERFESINSQRNDILDARDSLLDTIQEIEESASKQFMEAFVKVREYFKEVFRSLFTEDDDCDLRLSDEESPLDSEIIIMAKPKGKRPQAISQLSGGEKTLTATALLFSLYLLKPAPFCIFDEVDAPLDDANIEKFNKIIRKFSGESQFIIVTHNKQTMAAVDIIYGVYMQEQGVSSVSPVDFRELDHTSVLEMA